MAGVSGVPEAMSLFPGVEALEWVDKLVLRQGGQAAGMCRHGPLSALVLPVGRPCRCQNPQRTAPVPALPGRTRLRTGVSSDLDTEGWRALQHITVSPTTIGDIAKSSLVLTQFEHEMIRWKSLRKPQ
jgi:hypothetical protein